MSNKMDDLRTDFFAAIKCIRDNDVETMKVLIKKNKKILKMSTKEGKTLLHYVAEGGFCEMLKLLIESGSPVNVFDNSKHTPLHLLVCRQEINSENDSIVKSLIDLKKADLNAKGNQDVTPLMCACSYGQMEMVKALLSSSADEKLTDARGATVLHWAAKGVGTDCLNLLLLRPYFQLPEVLNACDKYLDTPLYYAMKFKCFDNAKILLNNLKVSTNIPCFKRGDVKITIAQLIKDVRGDAAEKEFLFVVETLPSPPSHHLNLSSSISSSSSSPRSSHSSTSSSSHCSTSCSSSFSPSCVSVGTSTTPSLSSSPSLFPPISSSSSSPSDSSTASSSPSPSSLCATVPGASSPSRTAYGGHVFYTPIPKPIPVPAVVLVPTSAVRAAAVRSGDGGRGVGVGEGRGEGSYHNKDGSGETEVEAEPEAVDSETEAEAEADTVANAETDGEMGTAGAAVSAALLFSEVDYDPFRNDNEIEFVMHGPFSKEESRCLRTEFIEVGTEDDVYAEKKEEDEVIWYGD